MDPSTLNLPGTPRSLWLATTPETSFPPLSEPTTVDVVIVGGGLVGLTAATLLSAEGKSVAVLEAGRIVQGVTGYTTAKITSQHSLIYDDLVESFGEDKARTYGQASETAIAQIEHLATKYGIDCDFVREPNYVWTEDEEQVAKLRSEANMAARLGLPATFTTETSLPFAVKGAVRFDNQARFHPRKYLLGLVRELQARGVRLFEETRVIGWSEGEPCVVRTERGEITARDVLVASHFPVDDKALYATRAYQSRSYVLGVRIEGPAPKGMYISTEPTRSLRVQADDQGELLLVGGEGHRTGEGGDTRERYRRLEAWARERFPVRSIDYRWSTQDVKTLDRVPYIGRLTPTSAHVYVATGFGGWGMTNGTVAALLLTDLVLGRHSAWEDLYNPHRAKLSGLKEFASHGADIVTHLIGDRFKSEEPEGLAVGEGRVVSTDDGKVAMYRGQDGQIHQLSPACTHMGCIVQWNTSEQSWDCPCHGSRWTAEGKLLHGPAIKDLPRKS